MNESQIRELKERAAALFIERHPEVPNALQPVLAKSLEELFVEGYLAGVAGLAPKEI